MNRSTVRTLALGTGGFSALGSLRLMGVLPYRPQFWWMAVVDALILATCMVALGYLFFTRRRR